MLTRYPGALEMLNRKMGGLDRLSAQQRRILSAVPIRVVEFGANREIIRAFDRNPHSCLLLQGMAYSSKINERGSRQIVAFHLPGDFLDLQSFYAQVIDVTVTTTTLSKVGFIQHEDLEELATDRLFDRAMAQSIVIDAAITREWVFNLGRREGVSRTAHLLSELLTRMRDIGAVQGDQFELPVTQVQLGDALGMSTVHTNRCLKQLTTRGLISWIAGCLRVLDPVALAQIGDFEDDYLHIRAAA